MRIGVLSDAHGNPEGLALCLRYLREVGVEQVYFLGDAVGYLPAYRAVVETLRAAGVRCLLGNHDAMLVGRLPLDPRKDEVYRIEANRGQLVAEDLDFVGSWPKEMEVSIGGKRLLLVHGNPWESLTGYIYPDADLGRFEDLGVDAVFLGHTHRPFVRRAGETLVVNVGSCGLPRDHGALACCAIYDSASNLARIARLRMDVRGLCSRFEKRIHPSVLACLLRLPEVEIVGEIIE